MCVYNDTVCAQPCVYVCLYTGYKDLFPVASEGMIL